ncbi:MAG: aminodeoxychorismate synthase component I [Desulfobacteraceae bacterium]|nr:aminodeoxychorismate synthase component I [Desulfobacteraceae bacterium]
MAKYKEFINQLPTIKFVHKEKIELSSPFLNVAEKFAMDNGTILLLSGGNLDCARYHILAIKPWLELTGKGNNLKLAYKNNSIKLQADPFVLVNKLIQYFQLPNTQLPNSQLSDPAPLLPIMAGLFGYFAYDLKNIVENLPQTCIGTELPDICLYAPSAILIHDKEKDETTLLIPYLNFNSDSKQETVATDYVNKIRDYFFERLEKKISKTKLENKNSPINKSYLKSTFSKKEYIEKVIKVIEYLKAGDIYQANLSQRFEINFSNNPFNLFKKLYKKNPASFFSFINAETHQILSTSPERFIKRNGYKIETRPIKGTIARGRTKKEDKKNAEILSSSIKDDAELTMIVDLMRNDLSRVARADSIIVEKHKNLEPYDNVFHLVSIVKGILSQGKTSIDFLRACFPGGSITGCPKIRAMEIIDELEPVQRHIYTGSIGYLSFHDTMDLSIAIRTATVFNKRILFSVGGGIVFDSDPEKEYQETLDKGKTIMDTLASNTSTINHNTEKAWVNGKIIDKDKACIPATCPGFQYGAGLFETIRAEKGEILRLSDHIRRLNKGLRQLFNEEPLNINWKDVITALLKENNLNSSTAAVKIILAKNDEYSEFPFFAAVFAKKYTHRLELLQKSGIELIKYPYPRLTPVADHKSLNYLYYYLAGLFAKENNKDEALILNPDMTISETNTCNIMILQENTVILPQSDHVLNGVTINAAINILKKENYEIKKQSVFFKDLLSCSNIILTNALMGAVPVIAIENTKIKYTKEVLEMINSNIVGY